MHSKRRHKICICSVILEELESIRKYRASGLFSRKFRCHEATGTHEQTQQQNPAIKSQTKPIYEERTLPSSHADVLKGFVTNIRTSEWEARQRRVRNAAESEENRQQRRQDVYSQNYVLRCNDRQQELHDLQNTKCSLTKKDF